MSFGPSSLQHIILGQSPSGGRVFYHVDVPTFHGSRFDLLRILPIQQSVFNPSGKGFRVRMGFVFTKRSGLERRPLGWPSVQRNLSDFRAYDENHIIFIHVSEPSAMAPTYMYYAVRH